MKTLNNQEMLHGRSPKPNLHIKSNLKVDGSSCPPYRKLSPGFRCWNYAAYPFACWPHVRGMAPESSEKLPGESCVVPFLVAYDNL